MAKINLNKMNLDEVGSFQKFNKKKRQSEITVGKKKKRS